MYLNYSWQLTVLFAEVWMTGVDVIPNIFDLTIDTLNSFEET